MATWEQLGNARTYVPRHRKADAISGFTDIAAVKTKKNEGEFLNRNSLSAV